MYIISLIDSERGRFKLDADNARTTGNHIVFYKVEDDQDRLVATWYLSDIEEAIDLSALGSFSDDPKEKAEEE